MRRHIKLVKNRSDIGAGTRGADMGIDAMEIAAINKRSNLFHRLPFIDVPTQNESVYNKVRNSFAKRIQQVYKQCMEVFEAVQLVIQEGYFPLILSGDHSSAIGSISAFKAAQPEKKLGIVWIDAHADLHSPYTSPSGNMHGMSLACLLGIDNQENDLANEVTEETTHYWKKCRNIGIEGRKINPSHLIFMGQRNAEKAEREIQEKYAIKNYTVSEMRYFGITSCVQDALKKLEDCDSIYVSFDVDSLDCFTVSFGTGTPVPKGFFKEEVLEIIQHIATIEKLVGFEVVEINPLLDNKGNKMAEDAFEIIASFAHHYQARNASTT